MASQFSRRDFLPAGLKADQVELVGNTVRIHSRSAKATAACPRCGTASRHVHSKYRRRPADLPAHGRKVELVLLVRRFRCRALRCPAKIFAERFPPDVTRPHARRTSRLQGLVRHLGLALGGRPTQALAARLLLPVSKDIDDDTGEFVLVVHWEGGRHTESRVKKPKSGEHNASTSEEALGVIREMAGRWPDESIAACLNRMAMPTDKGKTWNAKRVSSIRRVNDIHGYLSADKDGPWRTMTEAAKELGVTNHVIRKLIKGGILPANQVVDGTPYQIRTSDLNSDKVKDFLARKGRPCRTDFDGNLSMFPISYEVGVWWSTD